MANSHQPTADQFVRAHIERDPSTFDAQQYSFFDLPAASGVAAEALEDGLEAPPDEDGLLVGGLEDEVDPRALQEHEEEPEDYTVAGMFSEPAHGGIRWRTGAGSPGTNELLEDSTPAGLEAAMARSLPKNMWDEEDSAQQLPSQARAAQLPQTTPPMPQRPGGLFGPPQPQQVNSHALTLTPPQFAGPDMGTPQLLTQAAPAKATPMTLAELEAQMAADASSRMTPQQAAPHVRQLGFSPGMPQRPPHGPPPMQYPHAGPMGHPPYSHPLQQPAGPGPHMPGQAHPGGLAPPPGMHPPPGMGPPPGFMHGPGHQLHPGQLHPQGGPLIQPPPPGHGGRAPLAHHMPPPHMMMMGPRPAPGHGPLGPPHHMPPHPGPPGMQPPPRMPPPYGGHPQSISPGPPPHGPSPGGFVSAPLFHPSAPRPGPPGGGGPPRAPMMLTPLGPAPPGLGAMGGLPRPRLGGLWMMQSEVEHVMGIMYAAVHTGVPYAEDYYYQAFVHQVTNGRNTPAFRPEALRSLRADVMRLDPSLAVRHAAVEGLGKIVLSNIRTPKMLMDLTSAASDASSTLASSAAEPPTAPHRPLEQEPILAARIMLEDCHDKLLDIDDIDRCCAAAAAINRPDTLPDTPEALRERRALLAASIINAFRLPAQPWGAMQAVSDPGTAAPAPASDAVFLNLMTLPKGRAMLVRSVRVLLARTRPALMPPGPAANQGASGSDKGPCEGLQLASPEHLLWALLRNFHQVWGASISDPDVKPAPLAALIEASHKLAAAVRDALHHLSSQQQVVDALRALVTGLQARNAVATAPNASPMESLLPLAQVRKLSSPLPDATPSDWLGEMLVALLQRGLQLMPEDEQEEGPQQHREALGNGSGPGSGGGPAQAQLASAWQDGVGVLVGSFTRHVAALAALQQEMHKQAALKGAAPAPETVQAVRSLACRPLAQQLLGCIQEPSTSEQLKQQLRVLL